MNHYCAEVSERRLALTQGVVLRDGVWEARGVRQEMANGDSGAFSHQAIVAARGGRAKGRNQRADGGVEVQLTALHQLQHRSGDDGLGDRRHEEDRVGDE